MCSLVIRPAREAEYDAVARIWLESWESTGLSDPGETGFDALRARIEREIAAGWELYVAEAGDALAAMLAIRPADHHLDQIFVAPAFQGLGIGKALLAFARTRMPDEIWLRTSAANARAWRWYEKEGFVREREEPQPGAPAPRAYYRWKRGTAAGPDQEA
jgi:ribosomal protein S18 acetylase RimI-like enzyme